MMDSIGYQFGPDQQKAIADAANTQMQQFGPQAQKALQVMAMRIPSLNGGQPAADGAPMEPPPPPMPMGMPGMSQPGGMQGVVNGALNPGAPGAPPTPAAPPAPAGNSGPSFTFNIPGMATMASPTSQAGPGASQGGQMNGSPFPQQRQF